MAPEVEDTPSSGFDTAAQEVVDSTTNEEKKDDGSDDEDEDDDYDKYLDNIENDSWVI